MSSDDAFKPGRTDPGATQRSGTGWLTQPVERYDDLGEFASGGMSRIHAVRDSHIGRVVAKKVLRGELGAHMIQPFLDEARISGQLEHPNIVPIYDVELEDERGVPSFTMKQISGRTLLQRIREVHQAALDHDAVEALLRVLLVVCDTLAYAHSRGVIHRDLKPENIMVGEHGQIYVMDWGISLVVARPPEDAAGEAAPINVISARPRVRSQISGSLAYMASEQTTGDETRLDARTDVFGLGAILYQTLTGHPPYAGATAQDVFERAAAGDVVDPRARRPDLDLPIELCAITMQALARDPDDRHASVDAFKRDLLGFLRAGGWLSARTFATGEAIIREGEAGREGYLIVSGRCEVSRGEGDERTVLGVLEPGELFGELAIFSGQPRSASVTALEPTTVKVVTPEAIEREVGRSHWLGAVVKQLSARFLAREAEAEAEP